MIEPLSQEHSLTVIVPLFLAAAAAAAAAADEFHFDRIRFDTLELSAVRVGVVTPQMWLSLTQKAKLDG